MTLFMTAILLVGGTILFYFFEKENLLKDMNFGERALASVFSSVTARSAGFNTIDIAGMTNASKLFSTEVICTGCFV